AEITALESEISDLTDRFETRKLVERAKGLLISSMGLTEPEAFRWIQKTSMDRRLTMREVAETVLHQIGSSKKWSRTGPDPGRRAAPPVRQDVPRTILEMRTIDSSRSSASVIRTSWLKRRRPPC